MPVFELLHEPSGLASRPLLRRMRIVGLFGRYSYDIRLPPETDGRLILLHGDNGAGKTTILRLLWHLLSSRDDRGHRTYLARTPFERLYLELSDGSAIRVTKPSNLLGDFEIEVMAASGERFIAEYSVDDDMRIPRNAWNIRRKYERVLAAQREFDFELRSTDEVQRAQDRYIEYLERLDVKPVFLADDRTLHSDDPEIERLRERFTLIDEVPTQGSVPQSGALAAVELRVTLHRVTDWFRRLTIGGQNSGSAEANSIYFGVLRQLSQPRAGKELGAKSEYGALFRELDDLGEVSQRYEEFGLVPHFPASEFAQLLGSIEPSRRDLSVEVLKPFFETLRTRYQALSQPERMLRTLVYQMNDFLVDKRVTFNPEDGLTILTEDDMVLESTSLSSGERQLAMLLCTTVLAGRDSKVFIVDEPELSLGVRWQRQLLHTLLQLAKGTPLQFIVATHSVEISTGMPESLVRLKREPYVPGSE